MSTPFTQLTEPEEGRRATLAMGVRDGLRSVAVAPDGSRIVTGGRDGAVRVWDRLTGASVGVPLTGHSGTVRSVAVTPDGSRIVSGGRDGSIRVWDLGSIVALGEPLTGHVGGVNAVVVTPDGARILSGGEDGSLRVWDIGSGVELPLSLRGDRAVGPMRAVAPIPDGLRVATGSGSGLIQVWELDTGAVARSWTGHTGAVLSMASTPDGARLATAGDGGSIRVWDLATGALLSEPVTGHGDAIRSIAITPDGGQIVSGGQDHTIRVWDLESGASLGKPLTGCPGSVQAVAVTPDGSQIVSCDAVGPAPRVWPLTPSPNRVLIRAGSSERFLSLCLTPDGSLIVTGGRTGPVRVWDRATGASLGAPFTGAGQTVAVSPDGTRILTGDADGAVRLRDLVSGTPVWEQRNVHTGAVRSVAVSPDGAHLVSGGADGAIRLWSTVAGRSVRSTMTGHDGAVRAVAVTPGSAEIISGGDDGTVRVWDIASGAPTVEPLTGHDGPVQAIAVTSDGRRIVSGGADGSVRVWDLASGTPIRTLPAGGFGSVRSVVPLRDGTRIVIGTETGAVRVWDPASNPPAVESLAGHTDWVHSVAVTPDGSQIVSGSLDGTIRVWAAGTPPAPAVRTTEIQSDAESDEDRLGITEDVQVLATLLAATSTRPPLSIALMGDWGSGKSTFIHHLTRRVAALAAAPEAAAGTYVRHVRQVRFNAWHYSDDHLWVGLVEQLFRELRDAPAVAPEPGGPDRAQLEADLARERAARARQDETLTEIDRLDRTLGWWGWLGQIRRSLLVARAAGSEATRRLRTRTAAWAALWAVLAVAAIVAAVLLAPYLAGAWASVVATGGWIGTVVAVGGLVLTPIRTVWTTARTYTDAARKHLLDDRAHRAAEIDRLEAALRELDPSRRLDHLLAELADAERYQPYRGLTGRIHHDLRRLSDQLAETGRVEPSEQWRIVLYVDDLDRCGPARVAEVLQAVNLLLTMRLFLVVVAVDPGWLLRALTAHHGDLLARDPGGQVEPGAARAGSGGALDYLDKIFHLPFAMRPMHDRAGDMLRGLLPATEADPGPDSDGPDPDGPGSDRPDAGTGPTRPAPGPDANGDSPDGPVAADAVAPDGEPLAMIFESPPGVAAPGADGAAPVAPEQLLLRAREADFLPRLGPFLPTPRAVKKLTNLYRLIRIGIPPNGLDAFVGDRDGGPFQVVALLLAALVGVPGAATGLLTAIADAEPDGRITDALADSTDPAVLYLLRAVVTLGRDVPVHTDVATYQRWAPAVARYSFETYGMFAGAPSP